MNPKKYNIISILGRAFKIFVFCVMTYILFIACTYLISCLRNPEDLYLQQMPDEKNRIFHSNGMSLIQPKGWKPHLITAAHEDANDILEFHAGNWRYPCILSVISAKTVDADKIPPSMSSLILKGEFKQTSFQGKIAFECVQRERKGNNIENPSFVIGNIYIFKSNKCYLMRYRHVNENMQVPKNTHFYLESFKETKFEH
ncbi:MAG: hypothetical protein LBI18_05455 [Planctomycetaceae bacterium]|jgi:hypothetical protein|nr:hypothetical protein [Planctomycetaceae bacterium]